MARRTVLLICAALIAASSACGAAPNDKLETKMMAVFKNGLGYVVRSGEFNLKDGWGATDFVPQATFGTFWMSTPAKGNSISEIVAQWDNQAKTRDATSMYELLKENLNKEVTITCGTLGVAAGTLVSVSGGGDGVVQVRDRAGSVSVFPYSQITSLQFAGEFKRDTSYTEPAKRIRFKLARTADTAPITLAYLAKGISWAPSYLVNIEDPKKARITLQSIVVNDLEDLADTEVLFVVGYPNFAFSDQISPMSLDQNVSDLVRGISERGGRARDYLANAATQSISLYAGEEMGRIAGPEYSTVGTPGQAEEDLFMYTKRVDSLKKGERAAYILFSDQVDYEHIYEWTVEDQSGVDPWGNRRNEREGEVRPQDAVWHSLRLANSTDYPWTTAPALVVSGNKPLAQDQLSYISKGAKGTLKMTIATDISVDKIEDEIERKHGVMVGTHHYDEVKVKGELSITNFKSEAVKLVIKKNAIGEVITSGDGKVRKLAAGLAAVNPKSVIEWEVTLGAGKSAKLGYEYKVYIYT